MVGRWVGSFSYTPHAGIFLVVRRVGSLCYTSRLKIHLIIRLVRSRLIRPTPLCLVVRRLRSMVLKSVWLFGGWGVPTTRPVLESVSSFVGWRVSYTSRAEICLVVHLVGSPFYTPVTVLIGQSCLIWTASKINEYSLPATS